MRGLAKRVIGRAVAFIRRRYADKIAVLNYHSVGVGARGSQPAVLFREQMAWLAGRGGEFTVLPLREALSQTGCYPGSRVLITFDDGYRDNAEVAAPILEEFGYRGVFFVCSAFIEGDLEITAGFKNYRGLDHMTWEQVGSLVEGGHEIGLHGHAHLDYGSLSRQQAEDDISRCMELVRSRLGVFPIGFAYPFGQLRHLRDDLADVFERLGIRYAFTTENRRLGLKEIGRSTARFTIPRLRIDPKDDVRVFAEKVHGYWDWVAFAQSARARFAFASNRLGQPRQH